ncbi:MAG TPA: ABC transporter family substrate-binding protein, partial [Mycobacterium sp.]
LASRYGCPALEATPVATTAPQPAATPSPTSPAKPSPTTPQAEPRSTTTTVAPPPEPDTGELFQAPSNITGICDRGIQPRIDAALRGTADIGEVIAEVEPNLWNMWTVLPILQDTTIVASGPRLQNVSLTGAVPVGIVGDAGKWVKLPQ